MRRSLAVVFVILLAVIGKAWGQADTFSIVAL